MCVTALQSLRWLAVYAVTYPFAYCCIVVTKLLVIDRMMDFSKLKGNSRLVLLRRLLVACIVIGNVVGLVGNIAAAVYYAKAADTYDLVHSSLSNVSAAVESVQLGTTASSIQFGLEAIMNVLIVAAVSAVGVVTARNISFTLNSLRSFQLFKLSAVLNEPETAQEAGFLKDTSDRALKSGSQMLRQVVITCAVVFIAFLLRAIYTTIFTLATALQVNSLITCSGYTDRCNGCYNLYSHIIVWLLSTPDFCFSVAFISQPFTLLVALWGMTSGQTLAIIQNANVLSS